MGTVGATRVARAAHWHSVFCVPEILSNQMLESKMTKEMIQDAIRFLMKVVGTWVLATNAAKSGGITPDSWQTITAAALVLGSFGWSLYSTHKLTK